MIDHSLMPDIEIMRPSHACDVLDIAAVCKISVTRDELRVLNGMVITVDSRVRGFILYLPRLDTIVIYHIAIARNFQRKHLGTILIDRLKSRAMTQNRSSLDVAVRETDVTSQVFFRACGFLHMFTSHGMPGANEDVYHMDFLL